jgi:hypothetical protein
MGDMNGANGDVFRLDVAITDEGDVTGSQIWTTLVAKFGPREQRAAEMIDSFGWTAGVRRCSI